MTRGSGSRFREEFIVHLVSLWRADPDDVRCQVALALHSGTGELSALHRTSAVKLALFSLKRLFPAGVALALAVSTDVTEALSKIKIHNFLTTKTPVSLYFEFIFPQFANSHW